jgi:DNA-binding MltR family transcriptional regulator
MISNNKILNSDNTFSNLLELRNQLKYNSKEYIFLSSIIKQHIKELENKNQEFIKLYYKK